MDAQMASRVVGFLEYGKALENFDRLVSISSEEELEAVDELISQRDQFTVYSNLSNQLPTPQSRELSSSSESSETDEDDASTGARRGLAWIMALARVEFGAIIAGFTDHPAPYMYVSPDAYDFKESMELLVDGVLSHFQDLKQDREFQEALDQDAPIKQALTYSRRLRIVQKMLEGAMKAGPSWYSPSQAEQLGSHYRTLGDAQEALRFGIRQFLKEEVSHSYSTESSEFVQACTMQLRAEKRELRAGTAKVKKVSRPSR